MGARSQWEPRGLLASCCGSLRPLAVKLCSSTSVSPSQLGLCAPSPSKISPGARIWASCESLLRWIDLLAMGIHFLLCDRFHLLPGGRGEDQTGWEGPALGKAMDFGSIFLVVVESGKAALPPSVQFPSLCLKRGSQSARC